MPGKERRAKEKTRAYEKDGDYGQIECSYVFGNSGFKHQSLACKMADLLSWMKCFQQKRDVLKPEEVDDIRLMVGVRHVHRQCTDGAHCVHRWCTISAHLVHRRCWELLPDGGIKVLRIKEKRPNFPWKEKGQKRANGGTKTGNIEGITPSTEKGHAEGAPFSVVKRADWEQRLMDEQRRKREEREAAEKAKAGGEAAAA